MKKFIISFLCLLAFSTSTFAVSDKEIIQEQTIQNRINDIGTQILNANKIKGHIIFVYDKEAKDSLLKMDTTVTSRQIIMFREYYKFIADDNELAAYLSREIARSSRTFDGMGNGCLIGLLTHHCLVPVYQMTIKLWSIYAGKLDFSAYRYTTI